MITILGLVREAKNVKMGTMHGVDDLFICHKLRVLGVPQPPRMAITIRWKLRLAIS